LDVAVGAGIDLLEVAVTVGGIARDAVLEDLDAAKMEVAREPRAADREARVLAPFRLYEDARDVVEDVLDGGRRRALLVGRIRYDGDGARNAAELCLHLGSRRDVEAAPAVECNRSAGTRWRGFRLSRLCGDDGCRSLRPGRRTL